MHIISHLLFSHNTYHYPYMAFGGQNKIVYSKRFVTRRAILLILPRQYH